MLDPEKFQDRLVSFPRIQEKETLPTYEQESVTSNLSAPPKTLSQTYARAVSKAVTEITIPSSQDDISQTSSLEYTTLSTKIDDLLPRIEHKNIRMTSKQTALDQ